MARVFGPLPGGLAVSVVVVGAFLAASTGIVGATVVTMGLLSLPTMLRNNYSPEIATGRHRGLRHAGADHPALDRDRAAGHAGGRSLFRRAGNRAQAAGCTDALTYLGEPAVVSVGTLFQAALLPGILLALLYAAYAFGYALLNPRRAPAVELGGTGASRAPAAKPSPGSSACPSALIAGHAAGAAGVVGSQNLVVDTFTDAGEPASLRTNVSENARSR